MKFKNLITEKTSNFSLVILLFLFNFITHSLPFFRHSISSDDFSQLEKKYLGLSNVLLFTERPLQYLFIELQNLRYWYGICRFTFSD